jgi:hypothetical protein
MGPATRDFGRGRGGETGASPQRAVTVEPTKASPKRPVARRVFTKRAHPIFQTGSRHDKSELPCLADTLSDTRPGQNAQKRHAITGELGTQSPTVRQSVRWPTNPMGACRSCGWGSPHDDHPARASWDWLNRTNCWNACFRLRRTSWFSVLTQPTQPPENRWADVLATFSFSLGSIAFPPASLISNFRRQGLLGCWSGLDDHCPRVWICRPVTFRGPAAV